MDCSRFGSGYFVTVWHVCRPYYVLCCEQWTVCSLLWTACCLFTSKFKLPRLRHFLKRL